MTPRPLPHKGWEMLYRLRDAAPNPITGSMLETLFIVGHRSLGALLKEKGYPVTVTREGGEILYRIEEP